MKQPVPKIGKNIANITPKLDWTRKILAQKTRIKNGISTHIQPTKKHKRYGGECYISRLVRGTE